MSSKKPVTAASPLTPNQEAILGILREQTGPIDTHTIATRIEAHAWGAVSGLRGLEKRGLIRRCAPLNQHPSRWEVVP